LLERSRSFERWLSTQFESPALGLVSPAVRLESLRSEAWRSAPPAAILSRGVVARAVSFRSAASVEALTSGATLAFLPMDASPE